MSHDAPNSPRIDGAAFKVGIVAARYNARCVDALLAQAETTLAEAGVKPRHVTIVRVPGSAELPFAAQQLLQRRRLSVCLALGVVVRGDTVHYRLVAEAAQQGLLRVGLDARVPVIAGLVVAETQAQAKARCQGRIERGAEFARAALEMAALHHSLSR